MRPWQRAVTCTYTDAERKREKERRRKRETGRRREEKGSVEGGTNEERRRRIQTDDSRQSGLSLCAMERDLIHSSSPHEDASAGRGLSLSLFTSTVRRFDALRLAR